MPRGNFDDILDHLGMGRWNILYVIIAAYSCFLTPFQFLNGVYIAPSVNYTCHAPDDEKVVSTSQDSCSFSQNQTNQTTPCSSWEFDDSVFSSTLTSEFELICETDYQKANYQGVYMIGTLCGQYIGGYIADRFGRKLVIVATHIILSATSIGIVFLHNFTAILVFRFFNGFVYLLLPFVLAMEVCHPKHRSVVGILAGLPWALGTMFWGIAAYFIRDWRYLQMTVSLPSILIFIPIFLMDESPRWLIVQGHHQKALQVLKKAARWNSQTLPPDSQLLKIMKEIEEETDDSTRKKGKKVNTTNTSINKEDEMMQSSLEIVKKSCSPKLFRTREISIITTVLCFTLFCVSLIFDGLNLSGEIYDTDPFLYIILGGLVEAPGYSLAAPVIQRIGRKKPIVISLFLCGAVILTVVFIPAHIGWLVMTLVLTGKLAISAAYQIIYVYATELFPTEVRSEGIGVICVFQQVASVASPYLTAVVGPLVPWLPSVLFSVTSFLSGALIMVTLKETLNTPLPDTISGLTNMYKKKGHSAVDDTHNTLQESC